MKSHSIKMMFFLVQIQMRTDQSVFLVIYFMRNVKKIKRDDCTG